MRAMGDLDQVADMEGRGGRVEADVVGDGTAGEGVFKPLLIRALVEEPAFAKGVQN